MYNLLSIFAPAFLFREPLYYAVAWSAEKHIFH
jgi:hypothetical protein